LWLCLLLFAHSPRSHRSLCFILLFLLFPFVVDLFCILLSLLRLFILLGLPLLRLLVLLGLSLRLLAALLGLSLLRLPLGQLLLG